MIRATVGTWVSYLTTITFQVLFASHYGTSGAASVFVVTFGISMASVGILVSAVQGVALPRLLTAEGHLGRPAVRLLGILTCAACVVTLGLAALAGPLAAPLARVAHLAPDVVSDMLRISAAALLLQFVCGGLIAVALARGRRLLPAAAPALPTAALTAALASSSNLDVRLAYFVFVAGSVVEALVLLIPVLRGRATADSDAAGIGRAAAGMVATTALLAVVPVVERVAALAHAAPDAARWDYAMRSLLAVEQLIVGGAMLAALGSWSEMAVRGEWSRLRVSVQRVAAVTAVAAVLAASVALVGARGLVALAFGRGSFSAGDVDSVSMVLVLALPGFVADALSLVSTTALLAARRSRPCIAVGAAGGAARLALAVPLGLAFGAPALAVVYSVVRVAQLAALHRAVRRALLWAHPTTPSVKVAGAVAATTAVGSLLVRLVGTDWPAAVQTVCVAAVFAVVVVRTSALRRLLGVPR